MRRLVAVLFILPLLAACENFVEVETPMVSWNRSEDPVQTVVQGEDVGPVLLPGESKRFTIKTGVARPRDSNITGPDDGSYQDEEIRVVAGFRNLLTNDISTTYCTFGAKIVTEMQYNKSSGSRGSATCSEDRTYYDRLAAPVDSASGN